MNPLHDRIAQFRKMANDDPDNELGHYRLGQLLLEAGQYDEAVPSFRRTLELSPQFSRAHQLLAQALLQTNNRDEAVRVLRQGFEVADARGENQPREEMAQMLLQLGEPAPVSQKAGSPGGDSGGFRCQRPGCFAGAEARPLPAPPIGLDKPMAQRIGATICAECWDSWLRNMSIKVINELRLDLSTEHGAEEYDRYMREYLGLD
jgi:tetratricopeptide (TPR) repeat protein